MGFSWLENEDRRCRICLKNKDNYVYIFHHGKRNLSMKIMKLANIKIAENDGYPRTVCLDCSTELEKCFSFVELIKWADNTLKEGPKTFTPGTICNEDKVEFVNIKQEYEPSNIIDNENFVIGSSISGCDEMDIEYNIDVKKDCENEPLPEGDLTNTIQCGQNEGIPVPENNKIVDYGNIMPLNHVEIVENRVILNSNEVLDDPLAQKDPLLQIKSDPLLDVPSSEVKCNILGNPNTLWPGFHHEARDSIELMIYNQSAFSNKSYIQVNKEDFFNTAQTLHAKTSIDSIQCVGAQNLHLQASNLAMNTIANNCSSNNISKKKKNDSEKLSKITTASLSIIVTSLKNKNKSENINNTTSINTTSTTIENVNNIDINTTARNSLSNNITNKKKNDSEKISKTTTVENVNNKYPYSETFCSTCFMECSSVELLQEHKDMKPFICRVCINSFETHDLLETHFLTHKVIKCKFCSQEFHFKKDFNHHRENSTKCIKKYECEICHKMVTSYRRNRHLKLHKDIAKNYKCVVCDRAFSLQCELFYHYNYVHTAFESVECNICKKIFVSPEKLKIHVQLIHLNQSKGRNVVQCNICNKILYKSNLKNHMMNKHDDEVQQCEQCGKSIKGYAAMKSHVEKEHSKIGTFICKRCNQQFDRQILLEEHRRKVHLKRTIPKPAFCEICGKQYKSSAVMKKHQAIHSDEKPFKCEICGAAFKQSVTLMLHGRVHSSVGKYICDYCGNSFRWKQTFDKHVKKCGPTNTENNISDG